jgi:hypothetical protein
MWPVVVVDGQTHDLWTVGGIRQRFVRWTARETGAKTATLGTENGWYIDQRKVMKEHVRIVTERAAGGRRTMDFYLEFEPSGEPVEIAGTPDQQKGFGGFCFRFAPRDGGVKGTIIRTDKGVSEKDGVMAVHPWAEIEGRFHGRRAGARVVDDPGNPGYPNGWLMRYGFGFLNVSYPGLQHLTLRAGQPLKLHYRVILFSE